MIQEIINHTISSEIFKRREVTISLCDIVNSTIISIKHSLSQALWKGELRHSNLNSNIVGDKIYKVICNLESDIKDEYYDVNTAYNLLHKYEENVYFLREYLTSQTFSMCQISISNALLEVNRYFHVEQHNNNSRYARGYFPYHTITNNYYEEDKYRIARISVNEYPGKWIQ